MSKVPIVGDFSKEELDQVPVAGSLKRDLSTPRFFISPHPGFEEVEMPDGSIKKLAYGAFYHLETTDLEIELERIRLFEGKMERTKDAASSNAVFIQHQKNLKFHYKRAISIITPKYASGWNRWSESILEVFLSRKIHKIIWGSGNCGKSAVMAVLLYTKWRVLPNKRMVVIASRVMKDASARVFGYIKEIHTDAPPILDHKIEIIDNAKEKAIFCKRYDKKEEKWLNDDRACIISLPIKVNASRAEIGSNLLGKHPDDRLILAFDEAQDLPASMGTDKIFLNWYTNKKLDVYGWGNPIPVDFYSPDTHDLLFKLGADKLSLSSLKQKEKKANQTSVWSWSDTIVLHLSMQDSPKDDPDEKFYMVKGEDGEKRQRLHFLAGKDNVDFILTRTSPETAGYYSQVLGFPFIDTTGSKQETVLNGHIIKSTKEYPLRWRLSNEKAKWFMGVDPSVTGKRDAAALVCGKMAMMIDGRLGIDIENGRACRTLYAKEGEDFSDTIIEAMWALSQEYEIPLNRIGIETHGSGEVLRYAIQKHIEAGKWAADSARGLQPFIVNPSLAPTDRLMFKSLGHMQPAKEMVSDINTEYYVAVRCAVLSRQIFNIPENILKQFYNRYLLRNSAGTKYKVETKEQMRKRNVPSPNDADALCNMLEVARHHGFGYKFYNKYAYTEVYGEEFSLKQKEKLVDDRLGIVSRILGIGENFAPGATKKVQRKSNVEVEGV
jgi:hypothetical protein